MLIRPNKKKKNAVMSPLILIALVEKMIMRLVFKVTFTSNLKLSQNKNLQVNTHFRTAQQVNRAVMVI